MQAAGTLFLSKTPPQTSRAADGCFQLMLFAVDRIATHQVERWVVIYRGPEAEAFWAAHSDQLQPGRGISLTSNRVRSHVLGRSAPEIHALASQLQLLSPQPAQPTATEAAHA
jgi:hypothetical protein